MARRVGPGKGTAPYYYYYQIVPSNHDVWGDSDWAGDKVTRKSMSCSIEIFGGAGHLIDSHVGNQGVIALSSGEAEVSGVVKGTGVGLGQQALAMASKLLGEDDARTKHFRKVWAPRPVRPARRWCSTGPRRPSSTR